MKYSVTWLLQPDIGVHKQPWGPYDGRRLSCITTNGSSFLRAGASSLIRSDFISQLPKISMPARRQAAWGRRAQRGRVSTMAAENKSGVNECGEKREWNKDGEITWKVMNITVAWAVWSSLRGVVPVSDPQPKAGLVTTITGRGGSSQSLSLSETKPEIHKSSNQYGRWMWGSATGADPACASTDGAKDK